MLGFVLSITRCYVRAPTRAEVKITLKRVLPCFEYAPFSLSINIEFSHFLSPNRAAGLATGCEVKISQAEGTFDLRQNKALGTSSLPYGRFD